MANGVRDSQSSPLRLSLAILPSRALRDSVSLRGDTSTPVISSQHLDNRRVFSYGGGGLKVRR
jgi:hypothetical protein